MNAKKSTSYDSLGCSTLVTLLIGVFCAALFL
jgi:hypothetical protein